MEKYSLTERDKDEFYNLTLNLSYVLEQMTYQDKLVLFMHCWQRKSVREIANVMRVSWERADRMVDEALAELRHLIFIADDLKEANGY